SAQHQRPPPKRPPRPTRSNASVRPRPTSATPEPHSAPPPADTPPTPSRTRDHRRHLLLVWLLGNAGRQRRDGLALLPRPLRRPVQDDAGPAGAVGDQPSHYRGAPLVTQLSPSRVATMLDQTAALLAEHGAATTRRVHDLALGATHHAGGPGQRNAISDPTGPTAINPPDPLAALERRRLLAIADLGAIAPSQPREGTQEARTAARLRDTAQRLNEGDRRLLGWLHELNRIAWELQHVIYECMPMDREQAEEELRERDHLAHRAKDCDA